MATSLIFSILCCAAAVASRKKTASYPDALRVLENFPADIVLLSEELADKPFAAIALEIGKTPHAYERVDLRKTVEEIAEALEHMLERANGVIVPGDLPVIKADVLQMFQLFQNLISNSLKFCRQEEPPRIHIESHKKGRNHWEIIVRDNGIGFDEKYAERIFKPFERLHGKSEYEGSGIGLAICKKIVERHKGSITVTSQMGIGSTFLITLPEEPD